MIKHYFGKSSKSLFKIKNNFFKQNDNYLIKQSKKGTIYKSQPIRKKCKACDKKLYGKYFISHKIKYIECKICTHLNGIYEDSEAFNKKIYLDQKENSYSKNYHQKNLKDYNFRKNQIYKPKSIFLNRYFKRKKINLSKIQILDIGAGSGYFMSSLIDQGFKNLTGIELNKKQVDFGKAMLIKQKKYAKLIHVDYKNVFEYANLTKSNCITLIGVIEHLREPRRLFEIISANKNIKYLYFSVPIYSLSCLFESIFPNVFNRHLGGSHTHLFTEKSLKNFLGKFNFHTEEEWWFGLDFLDLYRSFHYEAGNKGNGALNKKLNEFKKIIDDLQIVIDKNKLSSEVHMICKKRS